jgi:ubiquinone biosynthesis protein COQ9
MAFADLSLADMRPILAAQVAVEAAFDGWSMTALDHAATALGIAPEAARLAFPDGAIAMIDAWVLAIDAAMAEALPATTLASLPVRERIRRLVQFRLDHVADQRESLRRALAIMAMPRHLARGVKMGWRSADAMWRLAGDQATDYNHYTKRATLAAVYAATLSVFVDDSSEGASETAAFLDRRIAGIMRFEKAKARWTANPELHFSPARFLGRLRYPSR